MITVDHDVSVLMCVQVQLGEYANFQDDLLGGDSDSSLSARTPATRQPHGPHTGTLYQTQCCEYAV